LRFKRIMIMSNDGYYEDSDDDDYNNNNNNNNRETAVSLPRENIILALVAGTVLLLLFANFPSRFNRSTIYSISLVPQC